MRSGKLGLVAAVVVALGVGGAGGWAATTVLAPPAEVLESLPFTVAVVAEGQVGSSINVNATAAWTTAPVATNLASGTVTSVAAPPGRQVKAGAVLYSVGLRPVVVAEGAVPAFRALSRGTDGADVAQLQRLLRGLGFFHGDADGRFRAGTQRAVRAWQRSLGLPASGTVQAADVVFVPKLPLRVRLDPAKVAVGMQLSGGERVIEALPDTPVFRLPVSDTQAALLPPGVRVEVTAPSGGIWTAFTAERTVDPVSGAITVGLAGVDGGPICGGQCHTVPIAESSVLRAKAVTVEPVSGLTVPSAALVTGGDGRVAVVDETGVRVPVTVLASARGMSVIDGVAAGVRVRVPGRP